MMHYRKQSQALELDLRRKIYDFVVKVPGCHFREIERKLSISGSSVKYHLNYLSKHDIIKEEKMGNKICYYPLTFNTVNVAVMGLLRQNSIRKIILCILTVENCDQKKLSEFTGLSSSTVSWYIKKLETSNIIGYVKKRNVKHYNILVDKDELIKLLITYKKTFLDTMLDRMVDMWE